jgi:hypothetical protein
LLFVNRLWYMATSPKNTSDSGRQRLSGHPRPRVAPPTLAVPSLFTMPDNGTSEERLALAQAQAAWLVRQKNLDPRLLRFSRLITAAEVDRSVVVLRSLFDCASFERVSLLGAVLWMDALYQAVTEAEELHRPSTIALPYRWIPKCDLEELEADEAELDAFGLASALTVVQTLRRADELRTQRQQSAQRWRLLADGEPHCSTTCAVSEKAGPVDVGQ